MRFPTPWRASFCARSRLLSLLIASSFIAACTNPMSLENYNKLQLGQTVDEVNKIVGAPGAATKCSGCRSFFAILA